MTDPGRAVPTTRFDVIVVGRGLFGSATARHLAERGADVVAIGPARPGSAEHRVYSSHDDEARLTRTYDRDERWRAPLLEAVEGYSALEAASGVGFHNPVGSLNAVRLDGDVDPFAALRAQNIPHQRWEPGDRGWAERWPKLDFPATHTVTHEPGPAGYIRPKRLIEAQERLTTEHGGVLVDDTVIALDSTAGGYEVLSATGERFRAPRVLVATGAFANTLDLLPRPVDITVKTEIMILGEVTAADAAELADYPVVQYEIESDDVDGIYMTPPVRYPDGSHCIKMGADSRLDTWPTTLDGIRTWFETATDDAFLPLLQPPLTALWPEVEFVSFRTRPCIVTYTPDGHPLIDEVAPGMVVATAGNGRGAKASDAWGRRAADLVLRD